MVSLRTLVRRLAFLALSATSFAAGRPLAAQLKDPNLVAARTLGSDSAPLIVYEMSDFQCPWCRKQAIETLPSIEKEFISTGKVRWTFVNFPLTQLHPNAAAAAEFAMCAAKIDKFWKIHDLLFAYQEKWAPLKDPGPFLLTLADSAGIPRDQMSTCLQNGETRQLIQDEAAGAARSGVVSTPTVYIEGVGLLKGAAPFNRYQLILDSLLKERADTTR
jgi:protein-disulfide isomerase